MRKSEIKNLRKGDIVELNVTAADDDKKILGLILEHCQAKDFITGHEEQGLSFFSFGSQRRFYMTYGNLIDIWKIKLVSRM